jgi:hypothetical protein
MFEILFRYPAIVARHQRGRFAETREQFLNHCAGQGMAHVSRPSQNLRPVVCLHLLRLAKGPSLRKLAFREGCRIPAQSRIW